MGKMLEGQPGVWNPGIFQIMGKRVLEERLEKNMSKNTRGTRATKPKKKKKHRVGQKKILDKR